MEKNYEMVTVDNYVKSLDQLLEGKEEAIISSVEEYLYLLERSSSKAQLFDLVA